MITVYKVVGIREDGSYCSAVVNPKHPLSTRYELNKTTRAPKDLPLMALLTEKSAICFLRNLYRDNSTDNQAVLKCVGEKYKKRSTILCASELDAQKVGALIKFPEKRGVTPPEGTILCTSIKPLSEITRAYVQEPTYRDMTFSTRQNFLKSVRKWVKKLTSPF